MGCHFLLQGIFLTRRSNPGLPHYRQTDALLSKPPGKPKHFAAQLCLTLQARILDWVAFPFSRGFSQPRDEGKLILKFIWKIKGPNKTILVKTMVKTILKKKKKVEGIILPNFKTYFKITTIKTVWSWYRIIT